MGYTETLECINVHRLTERGILERIRVDHERSTLREILFLVEINQDLQGLEESRVILDRAGCSLLAGAPVDRSMLVGRRKGGVGVVLAPGRSGKKLPLLTPAAIGCENEALLAAVEIYGRSGTSESAFVAYVLYGDVRG